LRIRLLKRILFAAEGCELRNSDKVPARELLKLVAVRNLKLANDQEVLVKEVKMF